MRRAPRRRRDRVASVLGNLLVIFSLLFLVAPGVLIAVLSFSNDRAIRFPPMTWGADKYSSIVTSGHWGDPTRLSIEIALWTVAITLIIVVPAVFALGRSALPGKTGATALAIAPLIIPISAYAVGLYAVFAQFDLLSTRTGIVLSHVLQAIPLVFIVLSTSMNQIRPELEYAAMSMGASRVAAWWKVTIPMLLPAILAGAIFAFVASFTEVVFVTFLGGPRLTTLPKYIFDSIQWGVDPAIAAVATLLMVFTTLLMFSATLLRKGPRVK